MKAGLKSILDEVKVDEEWRLFLNGVRYVFVAQSMMMLVFEEILNVLGATVKTMLWPFIYISGYTVANQLMDRGHHRRKSSKHTPTSTTREAGGSPKQSKPTWRSQKS
nr:hypothetical protein [Candidatus Bathyarchaeota archaeon]